MLRAWFAIGLCVWSGCQLDSQSASTSLDVKPTAARDLGDAPIRNHVPDVTDAGALQAPPQAAGRGAGGAGTSTASVGRGVAGANALATSAAQPQAGATGRQGPTLRADPARTAAGTDAALGGGAAGDSMSELAAGSGADTQPPDPAIQDAGPTSARDAAQPPTSLDAAVPDAATPPAADAGVRPDAAQPGSGGDNDGNDRALRKALRVALVELVANLGDDDALAPDLAAVVALVIAGRDLPPQLLATFLNAVADDDTCHRDAESENVCAATCAGLAVQCKDCADDHACRRALQRVCGQQIHIDRCQ